MWSCAARVVWHCFKRWKTQDAFMRPLPPPPTEPSMGVRVPCRCLRLAWNLVCQWLQWDFWSSWAGGAVPSPLGARHVRGTVVHVPDSPPWRGAAPTLNYGSTANCSWLDPLKLCKNHLRACEPWPKLRVGFAEAEPGPRLERLFDSKRHCCRAMPWQLRRDAPE